MRYLIVAVIVFYSFPVSSKVPNYFLWLQHYYKSEQTVKLQDLVKTLNDTLQYNGISTKDEMDINTHLGNFYSYIDQNAKATEYLKKAIDIGSHEFRGASPEEEILAALINAYEAFLDVQLAMGNYKFLSDEIAQLTSVRHKLFNQKQLGYYKSGMYEGITLYHQKKYDSAKIIFNDLYEDIRFSHEVFDPAIGTYVKTNYYLAKIYKREDQLLKSFFHTRLAYNNFYAGVYKKSQMVSDRYYAELYYDIGDLYLRMKYKQKYIDRMLGNIERLLGENEFEQRIEAGFKKIFGDVNTSKASSQVRTPALVTRAKVHALNQNFDGAIEDFTMASKHIINFVNKGFNSLSQEEKEHFYYKYKTYYDDMNGYLGYVISKNPEFRDEVSGLLYNNQLNTKAFLLEDQVKLQNKILQSEDTEVKDLYEQYKDAKQLKANSYFSDNKNYRDSLDVIIAGFEKEISARFPDYSNKEIYSWQQVRDKLKRGEAAVEIIRVKKLEWVQKTEKEGKKTRTFDFLADQGSIYLALIVDHDTKEYPEIVMLNNGEELEGKYLEYFRNNIEFKIDKKESFSHYWQKFHQKLKGYKTLYLSADGVYNQISLAALYNPATNKYLTQEQDIIHIASTRDLLKEKRKITDAAGAYLFGNPSFSSTLSAVIDTTELMNLRSIRSLKDANHPPLPGTEKEVQALSRILSDKGFEVEQFVGQAADESQIKKLENPKILHIATHGYFFDGSMDSESPLLNSGLLFSGVSDKKYYKETDGILTAYEASLMNLEGTDLVVLSACETGLGKVKNGEGVYGLQRALQIAGAKNVIVSLWKVDDNATKQLMEYFYQNVSENMSYRSTLSKAQEQMRKQYPLPYYWAAFQIIGL